jgi:DNA mismatch repair ATPase MutS
VNVVLGLSGAPVCAKEMTVSELQIFTSMRTEDNLEEHVSSFYAELQRIKALLEEVEKGKPVLFMLDEILKGTNSQDRHIGAVSLAKQLSKTSAFGLISTHDLELGKLEKELKNVSNYSFNSEVKGDEIIFPYKLDEGICKSFNASALMEKMGIKIEKE